MTASVGEITPQFLVDNVEALTGQFGRVNHLVDDIGDQNEQVEAIRLADYKRSGVLFSDEADFAVIAQQGVANKQDKTLGELLTLSGALPYQQIGEHLLGLLHQQHQITLDLAVKHPRLQDYMVELRGWVKSAIGFTPDNAGPAMALAEQKYIEMAKTILEKSTDDELRTYDPEGTFRTLTTQLLALQGLYALASKGWPQPNAKHPERSLPVSNALFKGAASAVFTALFSNEELPAAQQSCPDERPAIEFLEPPEFEVIPPEVSTDAEVAPEIPAEIADNASGSQAREKRLIKDRIVDFLREKQGEIMSARAIADVVYADYLSKVSGENEGRAIKHAVGEIQRSLAVRDTRKVVALLAENGLVVRRGMQPVEIDAQDLSGQSKNLIRVYQIIAKDADPESLPSPEGIKWES